MREHEMPKIICRLLHGNWIKNGDRIFKNYELER